MKIDNWKPYKIKEILKIYNGKGITQEEIEENPGTFIVVQSGEENNGVLGYIDLNYCKEKNYTYTTEKCLTVARSGSAGFVSYQAKGCVVGDSAKILILIDKQYANDYIYLFLKTVLMANKYKYTYGRKVTEIKYLNEIVSLPSKDGKPDWEYMESFIKGLKYRPITTKNTAGKAIDITLWKYFSLGNLFTEIYKALAHSKDDVIKCESNYKNALAYVSRTDMNNACDFFAMNENLLGIEDGNCIIVGDTTATFYYQKDPFIAGDHIVVLRGDWINQNRALFLKTLVDKNRYRYSYGRAFVMDNIKITQVPLPIKRKTNGEPIIDEECKYSSEGYIPDWDYMEMYIKSLPYGDKIGK